MRLVWPKDNLTLGILYYKLCIMTEHELPTPENIPENRPFHRVTWNGSTADIYDTAPMTEGTADLTKVYDRSDFATPIERVQVTVQKTEFEGEPRTALTATIKLDPARDDYLKSNTYSGPVLSKMYRNGPGTVSIFESSNGYNRDFKIEPTIFDSVHRVTTPTGNKLFIWVDGERKTILITNNRALQRSDKDGNILEEIEVRPPVDGTVEQTDVYDAFFKVFMHTMDYISGLPSHYSNKLGRHYPIGKEVSVVRKNTATVAKAGKAALSGSIKIQKGNGVAGNKSATTEDLPEIEITDTEITLDDVGGLEAVKNNLRDIAISFQHPEIMAKWGASRPQGVLLYGAPGTGKTMLAQALCNEIGASMWTIQSTDIYEKWLGNSESHIKEIFDRARQHKGRLVLFFDEFDSMVGISESPSSGADNARNAVAGIFKQEMNTLAKENPDVLVIAATNDLERIDPALIRSGRFDHKVYVPMPDVAARSQIISNIAAKAILRQENDDFKVFGDDLNINSLANETDGMSGADISEIFRRLSITRAMQEARTGIQQPPISQQEIIVEARKFRANG